MAAGRNTGIFRSDDSGENWSRITTDTRPAARIGGGDLPVLTADPKNPDIVYSASVVTWVLGMPVPSCFQAPSPVLLVPRFVLYHTPLSLPMYRTWGFGRGSTAN